MTKPPYSRETIAESFYKYGQEMRQVAAFKPWRTIQRVSRDYYLGLADLALALIEPHGRA
tara:strand:- start:1381 stop:1560 length:180 start_codon:yes stop_codon:yes gene_type:complete